VLGEIEHLTFDLELGHLLERLRARPDLVVVVQGGGDQTLAVWTYEDSAHPAEKDSAGDGCDLRLLHAVAQGRESDSAHLVGGQIVGLVKIHVIGVGAGNERLDLQRLVAFGDRGRDLFRIDDDVLAVLDLEALGLGLLLHALFGFAVDEDAVYAVARGLVDGVEGDPIRGGRSGVQRHPTGNLTEFYEALPLRALS
jgi:hypothetical protein